MRRARAKSEKGTLPFCFTELKHVKAALTKPLTQLERDMLEQSDVLERTSDGFELRLAQVEQVVKLVVKLVR